MTIIVADDNPPEVHQKLDPAEFPTVKQYTMPAEEGWFAGRALAQSQVRTQFYLWVDDDFQTKLTYLTWSTLPRAPDST